MIKPANPQRGIALITALLVVTLCTIAATALLVSAQTGIRRSSALIDSERAWSYAIGLESWVRTIVKAERTGKVGISHSNFDALDEDWAKPLDYLPVEDGALRGRITDLQGRFNLNNLATTGTERAEFIQQFARLFEHIKGLDPSLGVPIANAVVDWVDTDDVIVGSGGAESSEYGLLTPPYRAANQWMQSPSELRAVQGVTPEIYALLAPHIATIPLITTPASPGAPVKLEATPINVNTATLPVLLSLSAKPNASALEGWINLRSSAPVEAVQTLYDNNTLDASIAKTRVSVSSNYYLMFGEAIIGNGRVSLYSVLIRSASGDPYVIHRSLDAE